VPNLIGRRGDEMADSKLYHSFISKLLDKEISWVNDSIKCMLCGESYVPDFSVHSYLADISGEVSGTLYPAGGFVLEGKEVVVGEQDSLIITALKASDILVEGITVQDIRYVVLYSDSGDPNTSPLIGLVDFEELRGVTNGIFSIVWDSSGVFSFNHT